MKGLFWLFIMVILALGLDNSQAQSAATNATAQAFMDSTLSPEFMAKMLKLNSRDGVDREVPPIYASPLGLAYPGKTYPTHQDSFKQLSNGFSHAFAVNRGTDQDVIFSVLRPDVVLVFRVHRDGTIVAAVHAERKTAVITARTTAEAQADFANECAWWKANVDVLINGK
jgi:hypothetical protein